MAISKNDVGTSVLCPLIDKEIDAIDCIENRDCIDGIIKLSSLPEKYKAKKNYKEICVSCKWHNY
mgnify:FL=1